MRAKPSDRSLRDTIEGYGSASYCWCIATSIALAVWAASTLAVCAWSLLRGVSFPDALARGSVMAPFLLAFLWCRSNYLKNERMRDLLSTLQVLVPIAPTPKVKTDIVLGVAKSVEKMNAGESKSGAEFLLGTFKGKA